MLNIKKEFLGEPRNSKISSVYGYFKPYTFPAISILL
nr:MAG TPA: hypothetical protein [Caudoviricetes sp.]